MWQTPESWARETRTRLLRQAIIDYRRRRGREARSVAARLEIGLSPFCSGVLKAGPTFSASSSGPVAARQCVPVEPERLAVELDGRGLSVTETPMKSVRSTSAFQLPGLPLRSVSTVGAEACCRLGRDERRAVADTGVERVHRELDARPLQLAAGLLDVGDANAIPPPKVEPERQVAGLVLGQRSPECGLRIGRASSRQNSSARARSSTGTATKSTTRLGQPTEPSIWSWMSRFSSTAYSSGFFRDRLDEAGDDHRGRLRLGEPRDIR